jgi:hypothetical protein
MSLVIHSHPQLFHKAQSDDAVLLPSTLLSTFFHKAKYLICSGKEVMTIVDIFF